MAEPAAAPPAESARSGTWRGFSASTAAAVIVANMIGTGVFTSLGFQLEGLSSTVALLLLWVVGGVVALCGALSYAELGAALPRSGGEYHFLGQIYHPAAGFVSGWISASIGFAAPTALAAITFGRYLGAAVPEIPAVPAACVLILVLAWIHAGSRQGSARVQRVFTAAKLLLVLGFVATALVLVPAPQPVRLVPVPGDLAEVASGAFAVSLIYVSYAYTGWNAATYLSGELDDPQRHLPKVLGVGTLVVMAAYVLLNYTFLRVAPAEALVGQVEIGYVAARHAFGEGGASIMAGVLALLLVSTVSAMMLAGPRVLQVIGEDHRAFAWLGRTTAGGVPARAVWVQGGIATAIVLTGTFESILVFSGFTLGLNAFLAVLGVVVLRWRAPALGRPYRCTAYPFPPLIYLAVSGWTLAFLLVRRPLEAGLGLALIMAGVVLWWLVRAPLPDAGRR